MPRVISLIVPLALLILAAACGNSDSPNPTATLTGGQATADLLPTPTLTPTLTTPSALEKVLAATPVSFANMPLEFSGFAGALVNSGFNHDGELDSKRIEQFWLQEREQGNFPYASLAIPERFASTAGSTLGLPDIPFMAFGSGIWYYTGFSAGPYSTPTFLNMEGRFSKSQVDSKLQEFGYEKVDYQNIFYYALHEDNEPARDYPLRTHTLNRIALLDDWFLAAAATDLMRALIDVHQKGSGSLMDSQPHRRLADASGKGLLSGAFRSSSVIKNPGAPSNFVFLTSPTLEKYIEGLDKWEALSPYDLTLTGHRVRDGIEEIVISLYYADSDGAQRDRVKLEHRWNTLRADFPYVYEDVAVSEACAPFVSEVNEGEDYSILVATCPLKRGQLADPVFNDTFLWSVVPHWLLYPDLDELKKAAE